MSVFNWLKSRICGQRKALSLYKRGMTRANKQDHQGAIDDYTTTISMRDTPSDLKAMALYNRALVHVATGDAPQGADDLDMLLAMNEAPVNVVTMARQKLARMESKPRNRNA